MPEQASAFSRPVIIYYLVVSTRFLIFKKIYSTHLLELYFKCKEKFVISKIVDYKINLKELVSYETLLVLKESYENDILEITIDKNNSEKDFNAVFDK